MAAGPVARAADEALVDCYERLLAIVRDEELEPFQRRNALKALAALWQVVNGILPHAEPPDDVGL